MGSFDRCRCSFQKNPSAHPIELVVNVSKLSGLVRKFHQTLALAIGSPDNPFVKMSRDLLVRTENLPGAPTPKVFGMYLENFLLFSEDDDSDRQGPPTLKFSVFYKPISVLAGSAQLAAKLSRLFDEISITLQKMVLLYNDNNLPNKARLNGLTRKFIYTSKSLLDAAYATPSLASPYFSQCVSALDKFCWDLHKLPAEETLTLPKWAKIKETCDFPDHSVFRAACLGLGTIIAAYTDSALPQFSRISPNINKELELTLDALARMLDPFENDLAWTTYALLLGKRSDYFLWRGQV